MAGRRSGSGLQRRLVGSVAVQISEKAAIRSSRLNDASAPKPVVGDAGTSGRIRMNRGSLRREDKS
jgi:hypothetical protein